MGQLEKLRCLRQLEDIALFRWTSSAKRLGGQYIPLTDLRLTVLSCTEGAVHFSVAAPVLYMEWGRPRIRFFDEGVMRIADGPRQSINVLRGFLKEDETAVPVRNVFHTEVTEDSSKGVLSRMESMGRSPSYPVLGIPVPDMYRITRHPGSLRPIYSKAMLRMIGALESDSPDQLQEKFLKNIYKFGFETGDGWVVNSEYIAAGGICCATSEGITRTTGGCLYQIPLTLLRRDLREKHWQLHIGGDDGLA